MTIQMPKKTIGDWILGLVGKKRAFYVPADVYKTHGPYVFVQATRESFWRAVLRPKNISPPSGWAYID
jgi:hypothetical protein